MREKYWTGPKRTVLVTSLLIAFIFPTGCDESSTQLSPEQASRSMFRIASMALDAFRTVRKKGTSSEEALQMMLTMLRGQQGIRSVRFSKAGRTVSIEHETGRRHHILLDSHRRLSTTGQPAPSGTSSAGVGTIQRMLAVHPKGKKAKVLLPFEWDFKTGTASFLNDLFTKVGFSKFGILFKSNSGVIPEDFLPQSASSIYIYTHGGVNADGNVILATGVNADEENPKVSGYLNNDLLDTAHTHNNMKWIAVTPAYIRSRQDTLDNAMVYVDACHSLENDSMAKAYFSRKAGAYFGWKDSPNANTATDNMKKVVPQLVAAGVSAKQAYASVDPDWPQVQWSDCKLKDQDYYCDKHNVDFKLLQKNDKDDYYLLPVDAGIPTDASTPKDAGVPVDTKKDIPVVAPGTWKTIQFGTFQMGSPTTEMCRGTDETQHKVTLTRKFQILATEVTQGEFKGVMGYNPAHFPACGSVCPVENVSWHEAAAYANAMSKKAGLSACYACTGSGKSVSCQDAAAYDGNKIYTCPGYRLPTEAEWEYAYRAGTTTAFYNGGITSCYHAKDNTLDKIGWYSCNAHVSYSGCYNHTRSWCGSSCMGTNPVGRKQPNAWGLYDMAGNVGEWCHDWTAGYPSSSVTDPVGAKAWTRVVRGGSWKSGVKYARAADRQDGYNPKNPDMEAGFRLVKTVP